LFRFCFDIVDITRRAYPSIRGFSVDNSDSEALATVYSEGEVPQLVIHRTKLWIREGEVSVVVDSEGKVRELWVSKARLQGSWNQKRRKMSPLQKSHVPEYVFLSDHNFSYC
jgi:hypothetical protein